MSTISRFYQTTLKIGLGVLTCHSVAMAQTTPTETRTLPIPEDVVSVGAVITAVYDVISGPETKERDWDRFRSLFAPSALLTPLRNNNDTGETSAVPMTVEEFVNAAGAAYKQPGGFFETEIGRVTETYGSLAHSFSSYESFREGEETPFMRGINSFQLYNDGTGWVILSISWQREWPDNLIPEKYLFEQ